MQLFPVHSHVHRKCVQLPLHTHLHDAYMNACTHIHTVCVHTRIPTHSHTPSPTHVCTLILNTVGRRPPKRRAHSDHYAPDGAEQWQTDECTQQ